MNCPSCNGHEWPDKTRGLRTCPQCAASIRLTKHGATVKPESAQSPKPFRVSGGRAYLSRVKARVYHVVSVDGGIACACCAKPTRILDSIDGHLDGDGLMRIDVERIVNGVTLTETLTIPRNVRGRFCPSCASRFPVRPVGRSEVRDSRFTLDYPVEATLNTFKPRTGRKADAQQTWRYRIERNVDSDPTWAHTFDATWLAASTPGKTFGRDDDERYRLEPIGKHPAGCGCDKCKRYRRETDVSPVLPRLKWDWRIRAIRASLPLRYRLIWPWDGSSGHSPNRHVPTRDYRERIGRCVTTADTLATVIRECIALGQSDAAYRYARMAMRHPAVRRYRTE